MTCQWLLYLENAILIYTFPTLIIISVNCIFTRVISHRYLKMRRKLLLVINRLHASWFPVSNIRSLPFLSSLDRANLLCYGCNRWNFHFLSLKLQKDALNICLLMQRSPVILAVSYHFIKYTILLKFLVKLNIFHFFSFFNMWLFSYFKLNKSILFGFAQ